ncbi:hypothetical protein CEY16_12725 [Halalkalibacillus sediminis]|uniref:Transglutaminase-like domain-containing protein n=1 Tax=Halalkalibacillus sediminis TaxID=2018042 RepID=A0A2I0QQR6_9BACI|nr:transglutaminase domain-containing protein [Halalkalibacillus sediminis]PKR76677.1 hypothetical protein CEY16_12725 [Halalkalibacillus sediminis]
MNLSTQQSKQLIGLILYAGAFLLLLEWLFPLEQITDTDNVFAFYLYLGLCFLLTVSFLPTWSTSILKFLGLVFVMDQLFYPVTIFSREWFSLFYNDIATNISLAISQNWLQLTPSFRTLLFLVLLWMMSYLLYYWFVVVKKPFSFILFTIVYLTLLDTFTYYDAGTPIIRVFIVSVAILGVAHIYRVLDKEGISTDSSRTLVKWVVPLLAVIAFSTVIGYAAPKFDPQWPDPVPYLEGTAEKTFGGGGSGTQRIGYGENDDRLGGGFIADDTTVFYAQAKSSGYWKVETKDTYTGLGWERTREGEFLEAPGSGQARELPELNQYNEEIVTEFNRSEIQFEELGNLTKLPYRYGLSVLFSENGTEFEYNPITGEIFPLIDGERELIDGVTSAVDEHAYPINKMRESTYGEIPQEYLQLPDDLPQRVVDLAEEIAANGENPYDKAKLIESYFSMEGFEYETEDVPVPEEDEDYVDQFLFESQKGYCDNFSTSMVVMLRAIDIPARWVKGFTGGEPLYNQEVFEDNELKSYEVQNNNAHSWVEVYFPEVGWVPFEPTVGFSNESDFTLGEDVETGEDESEENDPLEAPEQEEELPEPDQGEETPEGESDSDNAGAIYFKWQYWLLGLALIGLLTYLLIRYRYQLMTKWKKAKFNRRNDLDTLTKSYKYLLQVLDKEGFSRKEGQTLREFARDVDRFLGNSDMSQLTNYYERAIYKEEDIHQNHDYIYQLWHRIVRYLA